MELHPELTASSLSAAARPGFLRSALLTGVAVIVFTSTAPASSGPPALRDGDVWSPTLEWSWSLLGRRVGASGLVVADFDGDGELEIVGSNHGSGSPGAVGDVWFELGYEGEVDQTWSSLPFSERIVRLRPLEVAGGTNLAIGTTTALQIVDGDSKAILRQVPSIATDLLDFLIEDLDSDGFLELAICDLGELVVLDFETLAPVGSVPAIDCRSLDSAQVDSDPSLELFVRLGAGGLILDGATLGTEWSASESLGVAARFVDLQSDGDAELICIDPVTDDLRALELPSGATLWTSTVGNVDAVSPVVLEEPEGRRLLAGKQELWAIDVLNGEIQWNVAVDSRQFLGLTAADLDSDGVPEAVFGADQRPGAGERLVVVDLATHAVEHETFSFTPPLVDVHAARVSGDGMPHLVTASLTSRASGDGGRLIVLDPVAHRLTYASTTPEPIVPSVVEASIAGQMDSDVQLELCTAGGNGLYCEDGLSHERHWLVFFPDEVDLSAISLADLQGDGRSEILVGARSGLVYALDAATGWLRWRSPPTDHFTHATRIELADVDGVSGPEIVSWTSSAYVGYLALLDPADGSFLWGPETYFGATAMGLAQLDDDIELEIVLGFGFGDVSVVDLNQGDLEPPLANLATSIGGIADSDVDGDGTTDLVVRTAERVVVLGGTQQSVLWESPFLGGSGGTEAVVVDNVDLDLAGEIVTTFGGSIAVFEFPFPGLFADGFESGDASGWSASAPLEGRESPL
ncbi:MAG: hypothetical protein AMXMBFR36_00560 [Acidobacteriota bacterium]